MGLFLFDFEFKVPCIRNREGKITSGRSADSRFRDTQGTKKKRSFIVIFLGFSGKLYGFAGSGTGPGPSGTRPEKKRAQVLLFRVPCPASPG
jgi:hypothetical protein